MSVLLCALLCLLLDLTRSQAAEAAAAPLESFHVGDLEFAQVAASEGTTAGLVWQAGVVLAAAIADGRVAVAGLTIVEIGSGTGLVGAVAVRARAKQVLLTDMALNALTNNLQANLDRLQGQEVAVARLRWGHAGDLASVKAKLPGCVDLIIATDVVYAGFDLGALLTTLIELSDLPSCATDAGRPEIVLAYHERSAAMTKTFEQALQASKFTWTREYLSSQQAAQSPPPIQPQQPQQTQQPQQPPPPSPPPPPQQQPPPPPQPQHQQPSPLLYLYRLTAPAACTAYATDNSEQQQGAERYFQPAHNAGSPFAAQSESQPDACDLDHFSFQL